MTIECQQNITTYNWTGKKDRHNNDHRHLKHRQGKEKRGQKDTFPLYMKNAITCLPLQSSTLNLPYM